MHILIIEDEALLANDLQMFLKELGADSCALATTQEEALRQALQERPDLIASDLDLTEGLGVDTIATIQARFGVIPTIYITARPDLMRRIAPDAMVVAKPIRWLQLVEATQVHGLPPASSDGAKA